MQRVILTLLFLVVTTVFFAQTSTVKTEILSTQEASELFSEGFNKQLNFIYPIRTVYKCVGQYQHYYIVLTASNDSVASKDTLHDNIEAFILEPGKKRLAVIWSMKDSTIKQVNSNDVESAIWFWTKYCEFTDIDNDSLIDPIFIYGTAGINSISDGRIKILIAYKRQKIAIHHQNGIFDFERNTKVDKSFYSLPFVVQDHVKSIMQKMIEDRNAIFPYGWQDAMNNKKLYFDEGQ